MDRKDAIRQACLTATLAVAWAGSSSPAQAQTPGKSVDAVYIRTNFFHSLTNAHFVGFNGLTWLFSSEIGPIPAGEAFTTVTLGTGSGSGGPGVFDKYAIVGMTHLTFLDGLAVGFADPSAALGREFETVFPGFSEPQVVDSLLTGGPQLEAFFDRLSSMESVPAGINYSIISGVTSFSVGAPFGTSQASFSPIPEPVSGMVCLGALGFGLITRRRGEG